MEKQFEEVRQTLIENGVEYNQFTLEKIKRDLLTDGENEEFLTLQALSKFLTKSRVLGKTYNIKLNDNENSKLIVEIKLEKGNQDIFIPNNINGIKVKHNNLLRLLNYINLDTIHSHTNGIVINSTEQLCYEYTSEILNERRIAQFVYGYIKVADKDDFVSYLVQQVLAYLGNATYFIKDLSIDTIDSDFNNRDIRHMIYLIYHNTTDINKKYIKHCLYDIDRFRDSCTRKTNIVKEDILGEISLYTSLVYNLKV